MDNQLETTDAGIRDEFTAIGKIRPIPIRHPGSGNIYQVRKSVSGTLRQNLEMEVETAATTGRTTISPAKWASFVNQEMDRKLSAADISPAYAEEMIATWRDRTNHEFVRNFAVQHLERLAQERTVRGTWDVDSEEAEKVRAALEDAALEVDNSIGGTAMLALARLSEIDPHVDRRRLSSRSASLVANPAARLSTRIAAAQLCGLLRVRSALPALRSLASDSATPTPLRLSADRAVTEIEGR
jgi:hypothetical protein